MTGEQLKNGNDVLRRTAPAKLNLFLHVVGRRSDGYHELESLFVFTRNGDEIEAEASENLTIEIVGPFAKALVATGGVESDNLVMKAAHALKAHAGVNLGAKIKLWKNLPVASGIGGGSADAAAALLVLRELWALDIADTMMQELALGLGADVPACLHSAPVQVSGIGERIAPVALSCSYGVLLVNPGAALSTPAVFGAFHNAKNGFRQPLDRWTAGKNQNEMQWLEASTFNDLEKPAVVLCPEIQEVLALLRQTPNAKLVRMSGSGATCFALFDTPEQAVEAGQRIQELHMDWWCWSDQLNAG